jgi:hypothetical protein
VPILEHLLAAKASVSRGNDWAEPLLMVVAAAAASSLREAKGFGNANQVP